MRVAYAVEGDGPVVVLVHSSASGRRQWRTLTAALADRFRVAALDLVGYGDMPAWSRSGAQRLAEQSKLVHGVIEELGEPIALVGHSFGATVALDAAAGLGERLPGLVLIEPNPFSLLRDDGRPEWADAAALRDAVKAAAGSGDLAPAAERFADYWNGAGTWAALGDERRAALARALEPNVHEWDSVMDADGDTVSAVRAATLVVTARDTVATIAAIAAVLARLRPDWRFAQVDGGGHMAPLTRPDLVDPIVASFLDGLARGSTP
ncbi:MAG TPA: alpha/beta hydrolase [Gaiellaceae bacterium]|nr:alpha/beta hydrolase [Gaiellaceae bacterium]